MDIQTATLLIFNHFSLLSSSSVSFIHWFLWTLFVNIPLGGFVSEEAEKAGFRWPGPMAWGVAIALAPILLPVFLFTRTIVQRLSRSFDHRGATHRRRGYGAALVALALILIGVITLFPEPAEEFYRAPAKPAVPTRTTLVR